MKKSKSYCTAVISAGIIGLILLLRYGVMNYSIQKILTSKIKLAHGNDVWSIWTEMPIPMFTKFYFFNVTNPDQVKNGAKPILKEMGPYVYQEKRHKIILEANDNYVRYRPKITYFFRPDLSHGSQDDRVTLLNAPFVAVAKIAWDVTKEAFMLSTLDDMLSGKGETLFHTNMVREFLFDGVSIENFMELLSLPVEALGAKSAIPESILDGDFAFLDDRNGTAGDEWTVGTGILNPEEFGKIFYFNGKNNLNVWENAQCDKIAGTDGTIFPPLFDLSTVLDVFHPDACRTMQFSYTEPGEYLEIPTHRYSFASNTFGSLDMHPENECYCKETNGWCRKGGVFPLWPCYAGAPIYISKPHFMDANQEYKDAVIGLNDDGDYSTVVDVDQNVGLPIRAEVKLQLNLELQSFEEMPSFLNAPNLMFPILWMEETAEIPEELASPIKFLSHFVKVADTITAWTIMIFSTILLIAVLIESRNSNWVGRCVGVKFG